MPVAALAESGLPPLPVEADGASTEQPFHPGHQIRPGCLEHVVKMIGHKHVGVNLPACLGASLAQRFDKASPINRP